MPRKARIDAPGALHHIIVRGIERRRIFSDDQDCDNFAERLGNLVTETQTSCFAWALIPNHAHILLRTGTNSIGPILKEAKEGLEERSRLKTQGYDLKKVTIRVSSELGIAPEQVWSAGKHRVTVKARSLLCYWAVRKLGFSTTELSRRLGVYQPSVSISVKRGEKIAKARQLKLIKQ